MSQGKVQGSHALLKASFTLRLTINALHLLIATHTYTHKHAHTRTGFSKAMSTLGRPMKKAVWWALHKSLERKYRVRKASVSPLN